MKIGKKGETGKGRKRIWEEEVLLYSIYFCLRHNLKFILPSDSY